MGILKNITDEYFGKTKRDEDKITFNIPDMKFVDMGGSVLWADNDLAVVGNLHGLPFKFLFTYNSIRNIDFGDGLRLPTVKAICELEKVKSKFRSLGKGLGKVVLVDDFMDDKRTLRFYCINKNNEDECYRLTSDINKRKDGVKCVNLYTSPFKVVTVDMDSQYFEVRLVKDK